jgi:hypothetical protein
LQQIDLPATVNLALDKLEPFDLTFDHGEVMAARTAYR